jgi:cysteine desulfurase/selenocysteine lyase
MEHHANIVPWQMLAAEKGFEIRWLPITADGQLDLSELDRHLDGVKMVACTAMSNVLGTLNPIARIADAAHQAGALITVDASQYVPHLPTDVQAMGADFLAFTGHKMCGPTGIGVLWGRSELLDAMPPFLGGGEMIRDVTRDGFTTNEIPWKFEAGTPDIAAAIGLGVAAEYLRELGMGRVREHERELLEYALPAIQVAHPDLALYGPMDPSIRGGVIPFNVPGVHPHDVSQVLDRSGIAVRAGHHCTMPLHERLDLAATVRASFSVYTTRADIDALIAGITEVKRVFGD